MSPIIVETDRLVLRRLEATDRVEVRNGEVGATYRWQSRTESGHLSPREMSSQPPGTPVISIIMRKKIGES
ncbi:MAG: hypothetical protein U0236_09915 [Nitrospira sp.]